MCAWQLPRPTCPRTHHNAIQYQYLKCPHSNFQANVSPYTSQMLSCFGTLNVCTATPRPTCSHMHHNAIQYWYLKCLHGNSQGQHAPIDITMPPTFGTLNVCMATPRAWYSKVLPTVTIVTCD